MTLSPNCFFSRELSWLEFNQRVLDLAMDERVPLLERVKFLAISASNLDEFFMVRVGGLSLVAAQNAELKDVTGQTAQQQLAVIRDRVLEMNRFQSNVLLRNLEPRLAEKGIRRLTPKSVNEIQRAHLREKFQDEVMAVLTPMAIDAKADFPILSGARLCVCVRLADKKSGRLTPAIDAEELVPDSSMKRESDERLFKNERLILLPLGRSVERFWMVPSERDFCYMLIEDVISMFFVELFGEQEVLEYVTIRVTRNGDMALNEDGRTDLLYGMKQMLRERRTADCVRLTISSTASKVMCDALQRCIDVDDKKVYPIEGPLALTDYFFLAGISGYSELKDQVWPSVESPEMPDDQNIFDVIAERDRLLHHPYQSYDPVVRFLQTAATDRNVIAIKQTLYRTSRDSKIVAALRDAAKNGKNVTAILELKARFDEARNIHWATELEDAGVDVIYGVRGLKTHAKVCIVVRREPTGIRRYMHFGTGNYNESTANMYGDVSLFTCDDQIGNDAVNVFNAVSGLTIPHQLNKLSAAPLDLRENLQHLIDLEIANAESGVGGAITAKLNSLVDPQLIESLYKASQAGVKIRLNIRGICCLIPGKKNLSENIQVISIVDRFLEHSRILLFHQAGDERMFISSADWMIRNLDRRIELLVPVLDLKCKQRLTRILNTYFEDNCNALELSSNGKYEPVKRKKKKTDFRAQRQLYDEARQYADSLKLSEKTVFVPHRSLE